MAFSVDGGIAHAGSGWCFLQSEPFPNIHWIIPHYLSIASVNLLQL